MSDLKPVYEESAAIQLNAWQASFGTTQLTHALAERDRLRTENERLKGELAESNHWRERHCSDAKAYGEQSQKNWAELTALRAENERLRAEIEQQSIYTKHVEDSLQSHRDALEKCRMRLQEILEVCDEIDDKDQHQTRLTQECLSAINSLLETK